jgi:hypothetical protein
MSKQPASLILLLLLTAGCGLFDGDRLEDALNVTYTETFEITLPVNADLLCPPGVDCSEPATASPEDRQLLDLEIPIDLDIPALTGATELNKYTGKFREVSITRIEYNAPQNSLNFDLPPINLFVGPTGAKKSNASGTLLLGTIPVISAGMAASGDAMIEEANRPAISERFKALQASIIGDAKPTVRRGQPFPPKGSNEIKLTIHLTFVANPADAVK